MNFPNSILSATAALSFIVGVFASATAAGVPHLINYQGRIATAGVNFDGSGQFKFALVGGGTGADVYWTSAPDTAPQDGQPDDAVTLPVSKGLYSVALGDTALANMAAIPAAVFTHDEVRLRVWFDDGSRGWQTLTPDQRIAAVGYALVAETVPDGSIQLSQLDRTSVTPAALGAETPAGAQAKIDSAISGPVPGIYASAADAFANGVALGRPYFDASYTQRVVAWDLGQNVAVMGDSQTAQNIDATGAGIQAACGWMTNARALCGSKFDFKVFATGGFTTDQIIATHLPQVLASGCKFCFFMSGSNDGYTVSEYVSKIVYIATTLRAAGITPVFLDCPPSPLARTGNSSGFVSANFAARYALLPAALAGCNCLYVPCPPALMTGARNGVGVNDFFKPDFIHLNDDGANRYGRDLCALLKKRFNMPFDPYSMGGTDITANPQLAGTSGSSPNSWAPLSAHLSPGSTATSMIVDLGGGNNAWRINLADGGSGSGSYVLYDGSQVGGSAQGKTIDAICTLEVISGSLSECMLMADTLAPETQPVRDMQDIGLIPTLTGRITAADGPIVLRTPKYLIASPQTYVAPLFAFRGNAVFQISKVRCRSF